MSKEFFMSNSSAQGTALITGASAGIGAIYADRLARRGYDLILVARNEDRLQAVAERVRTSTGRAVTIIKADLNAKADLARVEAVLRDDGSVTMLVNNAGFGAAAPLLQADIAKMDEMIAINVGALTRLTYAAVPGFVARGRGAVINISSAVALAPEVLNGVYGASKAYVLALTQSLQHELAGKGIRAQAVLPYVTATEFWDIAGAPGLKSQTFAMTADDLVDAALAGFDDGEVVTIPALQDGADWTAYEAARKALAPKFMHGNAADRYRVRRASTAA
jgi:short-subunit dehydrogenase